MVRDLAGHLVVFLVDVAEEHGGVLVRREDVDRLGAVLGRPVPLRIEVEQRTVGEHDDRGRFVEARQVGMQPFQLVLADETVRIRDVVQRDEMHALVVEAVVPVAEHLLVHLAVVQARVVLAGDEADVLALEIRHDGLELGHATLALLVFRGRVRQVAGEHDEVGLVLEAVHRRDGLAQRVLRFGVRRALETPVAVGQLHKGEILPGRSQRSTPRTQAGRQDGATQAGEFEEIATFDVIAHENKSDERRRNSTP